MLVDKRIRLASYTSLICAIYLPKGGLGDTNRIVRCAHTGLNTAARSPRSLRRSVRPSQHTVSASMAAAVAKMGLDPDAQDVLEAV